MGEPEVREALTAVYVRAKGTVPESENRLAEELDNASIRLQVLNDIAGEREYEDRTWGSPFDDKNTVNDWSAYANIYLSDATRMKATPEEQRKGVLKAATLLVAAVEAFDRNKGFMPRHYDPENPNRTVPLETI